MLRGEHSPRERSGHPHPRGVEGAGAALCLGNTCGMSRGIMESQVKSRVVRASNIDFTVLEMGAGPLVLCLHGFPDTAHSFRHQMPALAAAGYHVVAPFMRGYSPTE